MTTVILIGVNAAFSKTRQPDSFLVIRGPATSSTFRAFLYGTTVLIGLAMFTSAAQAQGNDDKSKSKPVCPASAPVRQI
jgi:hypothetical protein